MAVKTTKIQCNQDVDLRGKVNVKGQITINSATNIKDKSLTSADAGKVLTVNEDGSLSWQQKGAGGGMKAYFDAGGKCSYSTATSFDGIINFGDTADITNMSRMFAYCDRLISVPLFDTRKVENMGSMFINCTNLVNVPAFDTSKVTFMSDMFENCNNIKIIPALDMGKVTDVYNIFRNCSKLEEIHMTNINVSLNINVSTKFTREALLEIIGNLKPTTTSKTLYMGSTNLAKLTEEDKAIATNKGWTLA